MREKKKEMKESTISYMRVWIEKEKNRGGKLSHLNSICTKLVN